MHKVNAGFTVLVPIEPDRVGVLTSLLAELDADQSRLSFAKSTTTHFATITIVPAQPYQDEMLPSTLLFATSYSGPTRVHVDELVRELGSGLREIFAHDPRFDPDCTDEELEEYLYDHRKRDTFFSGMQHLSPLCVRRHRELRDEIEAYIDEREHSGGFTGSATDIRREIQDHVRSKPELAWAEAEPWEPTFKAWLIYHWRSLVIEGVVGGLLLATVLRFFIDSRVLSAIVIGGWIAIAAFLVFLLVLVLSVHEAESAQTYVSPRPSDERARTLAATQARPVINEFTLAGPIKGEGSLRPIFLRLAFWIVARVVEGVPGVYYIGTGVDIPTVATARWIVTDRGRRVMFISNFNNAGEGYVRDFIETKGGAMRINLSFGFGLGFPKTEWIVNAGAIADPNGYLHSLSENQLPTLFWYGPYRDMSIDNIKRNRKIREGLFADLNEQQANDWLHLL